MGIGDLIGKAILEPRFHGTRSRNVDFPAALAQSVAKRAIDVLRWSGRRISSVRPASHIDILISPAVTAGLFSGCRAFARRRQPVAGRAR